MEDKVLLGDFSVQHKCFAVFSRSVAVTMSPLSSAGGPLTLWLRFCPDMHHQLWWYREGVPLNHIQSITFNFLDFVIKMYLVVFNEKNTNAVSDCNIKNKEMEVWKLSECTACENWTVAYAEIKSIQCLWTLYVATIMGLWWRIAGLLVMFPEFSCYFSSVHEKSTGGQYWREK